MDQPVFSVVTIFLNASRFLLEAVDSVFMQDHSSWELLLIDDDVGTFADLIALHLVVGLHGLAVFRVDVLALDPVSGGPV